MELANPFDITFTVMKIRYVDYDRSIRCENFLTDQDRVNVFINLESIFKNLSMINDLERKLILDRNFIPILASNIVNLAAHYKRFFMGHRVDTRVYLYHTDFRSETFQQTKYNEYYRSFYHCKYAQNPKFMYLTDALTDHILPMVRTCCEFIPRVYYICASGIEGSLIPYVVAQDDKKRNDHRKNFIITSDIYDTQYSYIPGFLSHYLKRNFGSSLVTCQKDVLISLLANKSKEECEPIISLYNNHARYATMLASLGNKERSIEKLDGVGFVTVTNLLQNGVATNRIGADTTSANMLSEIYGSERREQYLKNFYCTSIPDMYDELTEAEKESLTSQRKDRFDNQGLLELNRTVFANHPLTLEALCC